MTHLLTPLGRGGRGDSSDRGGVGNGGLWWSELASEDARAALLLSRLSPFLYRRKWLCFWSGGGSSGDDEKVRDGQS